MVGVCGLPQPIISAKYRRAECFFPTSCQSDGNPPIPPPVPGYRHHEPGSEARDRWWGWGWGRRGQTATATVSIRARACGGLVGRRFLKWSSRVCDGRPYTRVGVTIREIPCGRRTCPQNNRMILLRTLSLARPTLAADGGDGVSVFSFRKYQRHLVKGARIL